MIKVLFVCHGNICRSPMAEFIMKALVKDAGREGEFEIASAAATSEELGSPVYTPARRKLEAHGISCEGKRARLLQKRDYARYDLLIGMDKENMLGMKRICGGDPESKLHLLLEYAGINREVADPWYTGDFDAAWEDIYCGCTELLKLL